MIYTESFKKYNHLASCETKTVTTNLVPFTLALIFFADVHVNFSGMILHSMTISFMFHVPFFFLIKNTSFIVPSSLMIVAQVRNYFKLKKNGSLPFIRSLTVQKRVSPSVLFSLRKGRLISCQIMNLFMSMAIFRNAALCIFFCFVFN